MPLNTVENPVLKDLKEQAFSLWATYARSNPCWSSKLAELRALILVNQLVSEDQIHCFQTTGSLALQEYHDSDDFVEQTNLFRGLSIGEMCALLIDLPGSIAD
jgi:hypothetical protein